MAKKTDEGIKTVATNKKARHEYFIEDTFEAGLALWGNEVKSLRDGKANFIDSWVEFRGGEAWLMGLHISPYSHTRIEYQEPTRERKLLLNKQEIARLSRKVQEKGYTLLPLKIYFKRGWAKVEIGLGKGKKLHDKREDIKAKDLRREMARSDKWE